MKNLISLSLIISTISFSTNAFDGKLPLDIFSNNSEVVIAKKDKSIPQFNWNITEPSPSLSASQKMKYSEAIKTLASATEEYLLYNGTSANNTFNGNIYSNTDAKKYMNSILKNSEVLYMKDGSKINLDQLLKNNGNQNIIDLNGLDRLNDALIGIGINHAVSGPGGLGGS